jgi:hypothetical protein
MISDGGIISSTLTAPFYRMQIIRQVGLLLPQNTNPSSIKLSQIKAVHGFDSIFKGNLSRIIAHWVGKLSYFSKNNDKRPYLGVLTHMISLAIAYPFDKASVFLASDVIEKKPVSIVEFIKESYKAKILYKGFCFFIGVDILYKAITRRIEKSSTIK